MDGRFVFDLHTDLAYCFRLFVQEVISGKVGQLKTKYLTGKNIIAFCFADKNTFLQSIFA